MIDRSLPHRRFNPLAGEWVLVSPHRTQRPWQGQEEKSNREVRSTHDPNCYLCPKNTRANGEANPEYEHTFVFPNDFPALLDDEVTECEQGLFRSESVRGECRVICFSPRHDLTLAELPVEGIAKVIDAWSDVASELGSKYRWVQIFENKGAVMGCSNPHPHGQVWASDFIPSLPQREDQSQQEYLELKGRPLLLDVVESEVADGSRVVCQNECWVILVPFWATWPFEYLLLPRFPVQRLPQLTGEQRFSLSRILKDGLSRYDGLFDTSFPYTMGWHSAPGSEPCEHWTLHAHFYPPLLRSASVKKFMVGYEMLAEPQRDLTPELAAERLRQAQ